MQIIYLYNDREDLLMELKSDGDVYFPQSSEAAEFFAEVMKTEGVVIPFLYRQRFDGKQNIYPDDPDFYAAFEQIFVPLKVEYTSSAYAAKYSIKKEQREKEDENPSDA